MINPQREIYEKSIGYNIYMFNYLFYFMFLYFMLNILGVWIFSLKKTIEFENIYA